MSNSIDPKQTKANQKNQLKELAIRLGVFQREAKDLGIPTLVMIEGLDASEKGLLLNQVLLEIDARSYNVYSTHASHKQLRAYPLLWRFWNNTPQRGLIQFYDRGPYYLVLDAWAEGKLHEDELDSYWEHIRNFERQLSDDGVEIIKIFLTVPKKEQARRFEKLEDNSKTAWRVTTKDWRRHRQYKPYMEKVEKMIVATDSPQYKWKKIDTYDIRDTTIELYLTIIERLEAAIDRKKAKNAEPKATMIWIPFKGRDKLSEVKFKAPMDRAEYKQTLKFQQERIHEIVHEIHSSKIPIVMVYCGWDAAGKGGCIKRLVQGIDPRGYSVTPVGAPTNYELSQHYLWRFWKQIPHRGSVKIFDRSWYGRVLVERVEGLCSNEEWQRAYREINEMEAHFTDYGTVVIKFWLHIDKGTQKERFEARKSNPLKQWKITNEDWRNRKKWDLYAEAVNEMIEKTDKPHAPWNIIPSVCKMRARIQTIDITIKRMEQALKKYRKARL
jgi:AMP-polyphosphate phosphotransferase